MKGLYRLLDHSPRLGQYLTFISSTLAIYRGLPMMLGAGLVFLSCILSGLFMPIIITLGDASTWWLLLCLPMLLLHLGVLAGFIGSMMSAPLGSGYKEK